MVFLLTSADDLKGSRRSGGTVEFKPTACWIPSSNSFDSCV